jgi:hypothetical protein
MTSRRTPPVVEVPSPQLMVQPTPSEESHIVSALVAKPGADSVATVPWTCPPRDAGGAGGALRLVGRQGAS